MRDRTPTKVLENGALRYGVYDADGTFLRYEHLVLDDQPTQEGTPLNKASLLKDSTAALLGLGTDAVPDDAFVALVLGQGVYGYRVKVQLADGTPVEGATVSGIQPLTGSTLVTGEDGIVLGKSTSASVTIGCTSPYIDQKAPATQTVTKTGTITNVTLTLENVTDMLTIISSKTVKISSMAKTLDVTAVGGGGGGGSGTENDTTGGGSGGGGGYAKTVLGATVKEGNVTITIGSGGASSATTTSSGTSTGGTGGKTTVKFGDVTVCEANGGNGGISAPYNSAATIPSGGVGNGVGGGGSGGSDYYSYVGSPGTAGNKYIFDDTSLGLAGGGGGGGGTGYAKSSEFYENNVGGAPNGGKGDVRESNGTLIAGSAGKSMGGGGGGGTMHKQGYNGGAGGVYLRFHF